MAATSSLQPPPADLHAQDLDIEAVPAAALCRVSRHATGEPYFGRSGACRFDDAQADTGACFGTFTRPARTPP